MTDAVHPARDLPRYHLIATLDALKVFADPLRQQILETLYDGAKTVKQIAAVLEIAPTKLYYHINLMEVHGLIRVTETRIVSGIIEKQYDVSAEGYKIKRSLLVPGQDDDDDGLDTAIDALIDPLRADLRRSIADGLVDMTQDPAEYHRFKINRSVWGMKPERADEFYARLEGLLNEFTEDDDDSPEAANYSIVLFFYPTASHRPVRRRR